MPVKLTDKSAPIDSRSVLALLAEWIVIVCLMATALRVNEWWLYVPVGLVIATRQHALLILFHDAVHGHLARSPRLNDALINLFIGVPALLPVEIYRPLHMLHHRSVGTEQDPERLLLYAGQHWAYKPLPGATLLRLILGDLFLINGIRTIRAWSRAAARPRIGTQTLLIAVLWAAAVITAANYVPVITTPALLLWFIPLLTVTQLLQKLRSYAEHSGGPGITIGWPHWTYSWQIGLAGKLTVWPYNINYHREHHDEPRLRWHQLPGPGATHSQRLAGPRLWSLLHRSERR